MIAISPSVSIKAYGVTRKGFRRVPAWHTRAVCGADAGARPNLPEAPNGAGDVQPGLATNRRTAKRFVASEALRASPDLLRIYGRPAHV
jgi:hypothetical protein